MRSSAALYTPATGSGGKSRLRDRWRPVSPGTPRPPQPTGTGPTWAPNSLASCSGVERKLARRPGALGSHAAVPLTSGAAPENPSLPEPASLSLSQGLGGREVYQPPRLVSKVPRDRMLPLGEAALTLPLTRGLV